ncbi:HET domain containing protein [Rhypophila sp. PSN 637]
MRFRCPFCTNLSISHLIDLTKQEFESKVFPRTAYFRHHESFEHLEQSASNGCEVCQLVIDAFKATPWDEALWVGTRQGRGSTNIDLTMCARAKGLKVSDVKMSIDSSELWAGQSLEDVRIWDTLMVLVGPNYDGRDLDDEDEDVKWAMENWVPVLPLTLTASRGNGSSIEGTQVGRFQLEQSLASPANVNIARSWLGDCRSTHSSCLPNQSPRLPTRVIDVGIGPHFTTARIFVPQRKLEADYIALSHCWGGNIEAKLTSKTIVAWQDSLPYEELPANFKDAITITRELGIRYLWIDSLCILQDSAHDWEVESAKMGRVYGDSALTISAVAARSSKAGILVPSTEASHATDPVILLPLNQPQAQDSLHPEIKVQVEHRDLEEEDLHTLHLHGPLNRRGWCLQESILSPRVLFYGAKQIYWKCPNGYASADGLYRHARGPPDLYREISVQLHAQRLLPCSSSQTLPQSPIEPLSALVPLSPRNKTQLLLDYYALVKEYTSRQLTFGSDKFPAFSGLARRLSPTLGQYAAGIFLSDWRRGLLWYSEGRYAPHAPPHPYRAPSWSWAITDLSVLFDSSTDEQPELIPHPLQANLLKSKITHWRSDDQFGRLETGSLVIEGFTAPLVRSRQMANVRFGWLAYFDEPDSLGAFSDQGIENDNRKNVSGLCTLLPMKTLNDDGERQLGPYTMLAIPSMNGIEAVGYHDFQIDFDAFEEEEYRLLLIHADDMSVAETENRNPKARCLIIRPVEDGVEGAYERVGVAFLDPKFSRIEDWERRVVTLF